MENNNNYSIYNPKKFAIQILVLNLFLLLTACSSGGEDNGGPVSEKPELVQTPNVVGNTESASVESLNELELEVTINHINANVPIGEVLEQDPPAGEEIEVGQSVTITVSDGIRVPNLVGMAVEEASQAATDSNLSVSIAYENNVAPIDEVVSQSVSNDTNVNPGTEIELVVSSGVAIPDVIGLSRSNATKVLTDLGFVVAENRINNTAVIDTVINQNYATGTSLNFGSTIVITVSNGITVPHLIGQSLQNAQSVLANLGFIVVENRISDQAPIDNIINQSPTGNTNVNAGTTVTLVVSDGIQVPNVIGMNETEAASTLAALGFSVSINRIENTAPMNEVLNQSPLGGINQNFGSQITINVSNGITVPDVVGQNLQSARSVLTSLGFAVIENRVSDSAPIDNIVNQSPLGNTNVNAGSTVTLTVSDGILAPNVIGMNETDATSTLTDLGFIVSINRIENEATINEVLNQNPSGGINLNFGSLITLSVSNGITMPDLIGLSVTEAINVLTNLGLGFNEIRTSNIAPIDTVVAQSITSGDSINSGTIIDITVSDGITIPDVIGMDFGEARTLLESMGFTVAINRVRDTTQVDGQVFEQNPGSGTQADSTIAITLSVYDNYVIGSAACLQDFASLTAQIDLASAIRGGRLYDAWWVEQGSMAPTADHPLWDIRDQPNVNTRTGDVTWRCKECHGWDYKGIDGAFGDTANSHYTGFPGVMPALNKAPIDVFCAIHSGTGIRAAHNFSAEISTINILHLTKFLVSGPNEGLIETDSYIDPTTGRSLGSNTTGQTLYDNTYIGCASSNCHGVDGTAQHEPLGFISTNSPWETLHKIRYGQPGTIMPAYADANSSVQLSLSQIADVIAYTQNFSETTPPPPPTPVGNLDMIARGGRLYDNWVMETGVAVPPVNNPVWALQTTNTRTGADTWRCKECHGWDYQGVNGVYGNSSNSHYTGFAGILNTEKTEEQIITYLTNGFFYAPTGTIMHNFNGIIAAEDIAALAKFIKLGTLDTSIYIAPSGIINGSVQNFENGADLYSFKGFGVANGNCALCHDLDGQGEQGVILGLIANTDPWSYLHKVRFGQPNTGMPALINQIDPLTGTAAFDIQDAVDITHYSQSLPQQ